MHNFKLLLDRNIARLTVCKQNSFMLSNKCLTNTPRNRKCYHEENVSILFSKCGLIPYQSSKRDSIFLNSFKLLHFLDFLGLGEERDHLL